MKDILYPLIFVAAFMTLGALFPTPMGIAALALVALLTFGTYYGAIRKK